MKHDEFFKTVKPNYGNDHIVSRWQYMSGINQVGRPRRVRLNNISSTEELNSNSTSPTEQGMGQSNIPQSEVIHNHPTSNQDME